MMKRTLFILTSLFIAKAFAQQDSKPPESENMRPPVKDFSKIKMEVAARIDKKIASLQEEKACIAKATSHENVRECRKAVMDDRAEMHKEMRDKREERQQDRKEKMAEKFGDKTSKPPGKMPTPAEKVAKPSTPTPTETPAN